MALELEQRLVSSLVRGRAVKNAVERGVQPSWFHTEDNRLVYEWLLTYYDQYGASASAATVKDNFPSYDLIAVSDPPSYFLDQLVAFNREQTAIGLAQDVVDRLASKDHEGALDVARSRLEQASSYHPIPMFITDLSSNVVDRWEEYQERKKKGTRILGYESGYPTIDRATLGFQPQQLVVLMAEPKRGKTTLCLNMAINIHRQYGVSPLMVSFEMSRVELSHRHDAIRSKVPLTGLLNGTLTSKEEDLYESMLDEIETRPPFIIADASQGVTVSAVAAQVEQHDPGVVIVDGAYLMVDEVTGESNTPQALTNITRAMKRLAQQTRRPVIVSTQALSWKTKKGRLQSDSAGYCVDDATEILTKRGWVSRHSLSVGDEVLTLNHQTGMAEWQPTLAVNVFPAMPRTMLRMNSRNHSSLSTMNHRWAVTRSVRTGDGVLRAWSTSGSLGTRDSIPQAAAHADLPTEAIHDDALVELLAWFWTEGSLDRYGRGHIAQSSKVNPGNCERIRAAFEKVFGPPTLDGQRSRDPLWRESPRKNRPLTDFWFNKAAGSFLESFAPDRVPSYKFLLSLTQQQLDLFLEVSFLADGHNSVRQSGNVLSQKSRDRAEAFHFALILAGRSTGIHQDASGMWRVSWRTSPSFNPIPTARLRPESMVEVEYHGEVWCPTTANGTWFARRDGKTYFTGNSSSFAQDADVLLGLEPGQSDQARQLRIILSRNSGLDSTDIDFNYDTGEFGEMFS